jgi:hypothetical protein
MLSDLRESGSIEQDADIVLLLYREDYYAREEAEERNIVECDVAKNRHGEVGVVKLGWDNRYTRLPIWSYRVMNHKARATIEQFAMLRRATRLRWRFRAAPIRSRCSIFYVRSRISICMCAPAI